MADLEQRTMKVPRPNRSKLQRAIKRHDKLRRNWCRRCPFHAPSGECLDTTIRFEESTRRMQEEKCRIQKFVQKCLNRRGLQDPHGDYTGVVPGRPQSNAGPPQECRTQNEE
jgi:hypothetical protein